METASPKHPRVSKKVQRGVEVVLTVIWLGGTSFLLEVRHTGWWGPIVLLVVVVLVEVAFVVWNEGHLPRTRKATEEKPSQGLAGSPDRLEDQADAACDLGRGGRI